MSIKSFKIDFNFFSLFVSLCFLISFRECNFQLCLNVQLQFMCRRKKETWNSVEQEMENEFKSRRLTKQERTNARMAMKRELNLFNTNCFAIEEKKATIVWFSIQSIRRSSELHWNHRIASFRMANTQSQKHTREIDRQNLFDLKTEKKKICFFLSSSISSSSLSSVLTLHLFRAWPFTLALHVPDVRFGILSRRWRKCATTSSERRMNVVCSFPQQRQFVAPLIACKVMHSNTQ